LRKNGGAKGPEIKTLTTGKAWEGKGEEVKGEKKQCVLSAGVSKSLSLDGRPNKKKEMSNGSKLHKTPVNSTPKKKKEIRKHDRRHTQQKKRHKEGTHREGREYASSLLVRTSCLDFQKPPHTQGEKNGEDTKQGQKHKRYDRSTVRNVTDTMAQIRSGMKR